jgi:hypothetical protein
VPSCDNIEKEVRPKEEMAKQVPSTADSAAKMWVNSH